MRSSPATHQRVIAWIITLFLPAVAWISSTFSFPSFRSSAGMFFTAAACLSAAAGGASLAAVAIVLNVGALNLFYFLYQPGSWGWTQALWSVLLVVLALIVGYARQKWSAAELLAGRLSNDLVRLREELELQRTDLKRFHDLSVRLSSNLEAQRLLGDVLT